MFLGEPLERMTVRDLKYLFKFRRKDKLGAAEFHYYLC